MYKANIVQAEKSLVSSLVQLFSSRAEAPSQEEVERLARSLAPAVPYDGPLESVIEEVLIAVDTRMGSGVSLIDFEANHDERWVDKRQDIEWLYSEVYGKHLKAEKFSDQIVQKFADVSKQILGLLQDPGSEGVWDRRGLVIGHVQSGKTANYLSVIARAADAGYKFIIVIAGIHNNLRKQTQKRIDAGFVGRSIDGEVWLPVGVGVQAGKKYPNPFSITNSRLDGDFNKATARRSGWSIDDYSRPVVLVIKKNVSTLNALHKWLKELNAQGDGRISDVPMLMIDDEADNASINTNKEDVDPTKTNAMLRKILGLFDKSCYVGYTATPFANIFINPEDYDDEVREELFPRDFIYCLDAPTSYFGPDKVFIDEESSNNILEVIDDAEEYLPFNLKKDDEIMDLPPSLYRAINQFIITKTIRNLRGQRNKHCSMLINVSRFVQIQNTIGEFVSVYINNLSKAVKANYKMPEHISKANNHMNDLYEVFAADYKDSGFDWVEVKSELFSAFENFKVVVVNSKSQETLNYSEYDDEGKGLTAIAIGGLSLSRGLTIEGLCISYMYRNTKMYDTLMQMGRWFGYRPGYEDLCRVHLNNDSIDWYAHIAEASEELRSQIKQMRRDRLSPKQFGLYVKRHPDRLLITASNKMRSGEQITVEHNYSGRQIESDVLPVSKSINEDNTVLVEKFWSNGFGCDLEALRKSSKGWVIHDVKTEDIEEFITQFRIHPDMAVKKTGAVDYLRKISSKYPYSDVLLISIDSKVPQDLKYRLGPQDRKSARMSDDKSAWRTAKNRVASRGDEKLGLLPNQIKEAEKLADAEEPGKKPSDIHYRTIRKKPLLMIHALEVGNSDSSKKIIPAFGISFPTGDYSELVEVVANKVWLENAMGPIFDTPDDEDDYDE